MSAVPHVVPAQEPAIRTPPHNIDAERSLLGSIFIKPAAFDDLAGVLQVQDLFLPGHRDIFQAMVVVRERQCPIDIITVGDELRARGLLGRLDGGESYLLALANAVPTAENVLHYARIVRQRANQRALIATAAEVVARAQQEEDPAALIEDARRSLIEIQSRATHAAPLEPTGPSLAALSTIEMKPIVCLWDGRIERGELTNLEAPGGVGKSTFGTYLAAAVTTGRPLYGDRARDPQAVLWFSREEDRAKVLRPRAEAAGADLEKFFIIGAEAPGVPTMFPELAPWLEAQIQKLGVGLVFIDPIDSFLSFKRDSEANSNPIVRQKLEPLAEVAQRTNAAIVMVRHWRKSGGGRASQRGMGSSAFTNVVRTTINVIEDPDDDAKRIVSWAKMNNLPAPPSLAFRICADRRIEWLGEDDRNAQELADQADGGESGGSALSEAAEWLKEQLVGGRKSAAELFRLADDAGISEKTLKRAKKSVRVRSDKDGRSGAWYWELSSTSKGASKGPMRKKGPVGSLGPLTQEGQEGQEGQETQESQGGQEQQGEGQV